MKISLKEFREKHLPGLQEQYKDDKPGLDSALKKFSEEHEVADEDGNPVELAAEDPKPETKTAADDKPDIAGIVKKAVADAIANLPKPRTRVIVGEVPTSEKRVTVPATCKSYHVTAFSDSPTHTKEVKAYAFTQCIKASMGNEHAKQWLVNNGFAKALNTLIPMEGAVLLPEQFDTDIINLQNTYGVARRLCRNIQMAGAVTRRPRLTSGATVYFPAEGTTITSADLAFDQIELKARKMAALIPMTKELNDEAALSMGQIAVTEMARKLAYTEDLCFTTGDGTSTYGGMVGLLGKISSLGFSTSATGGQTTFTSGTNSSLASITLADLVKVVALCPTYARNGAVWLVSPTIYYNVMVRLEQAAGGNTAQTVQGGAGGERFLGYPVVLCETAPTAAATTALVYFGNFQMGVDFGDRRNLTVQTSDTATVASVSAFESDMLFTKATQEIDINCHDLSTTSAAGPVVWGIGAS